MTEEKFIPTNLYTDYWKWAKELAEDVGHPNPSEIAHRFMDEVFLNALATRLHNSLIQSDKSVD